jgi:tRNA 2-selenouridine synthase
VSEFEASRGIECAAALADIAQFDSIIDVRSPSEFGLDRLPGAVNFPVLSDAQRAEVGTIYRQRSPFEARRLGASYVARNIASHLASGWRHRARDWKVLVYCWRGGERSASIVHVLARVGWRASRLQGGYRAFRHRVIEDLAQLPARLRLRVLCGPTGSGKSRLLHHLRGLGAQVLDLESLAVHRGSVLGAWPDQAQPSQKAFETRLWWQLRQLDPGREVYVESESRRIGRLQLPDEMLLAMRSASCVNLDMPIERRVEWLRRDYAHLETSAQAVCAHLDCLGDVHSRDTIRAWKAMAVDGQWQQLVERLLIEHYDPTYRRSLGRNFQVRADADRVKIEADSEADFRRAALELLEKARTGI